MVKEEHSDMQQYGLEFMDNERLNSHVEQYRRNDKSHKSKPKSKEKKKVFYRDKMAELMNE